LRTHDFVILHILGCDITSHGKNAKLGSVFLEKIDREIFGRILEYVDFDKTTLVIASDHPTSSVTGMHARGMMPFLIYSRGLQPNSVQKLDEVSCREGPLLDIGNFMEEVLKYT
jgi:2,3-bisphosphoglycerate-independent phosphoglycerate mutase